MVNEHAKKFDVPPPEGWVEGKLMPPPANVQTDKPKWYTLTMGEIPADKKSLYDVVN